MSFETSKNFRQNLRLLTFLLGWTVALSPILFVLISGIRSFVSKNQRHLIAPLHVFVLAVALLIACISYAKIPENDHASYLKLLSDASSNGGASWILEQSNELLFSSIIFLVAIVFAGSEKLGFSILVLLSVYLSGFAILLLSEKQRFGPFETITLILMVTVFGPIFQNSTHLLKQSLATAVIMVGLAFLLRNLKLSFGLFAIAPLIHASAMAISGPIILVGTIYLIYTRMLNSSPLEWCGLSIVSGLIVLLPIAFSFIFLYSPLGSYSVKRIIEEFTYLKAATSFNLSLAIFHLGLIILSGTKIVTFSQMNSFRFVEGLMFLVAIVFTIAIAYVLKFFGIGLLVDRLLVYSLPVFALILTIRSNAFSPLLTSFSWLIIFGFCLATFTIALFQGEWNYTNLNGMLLFPLWSAF